MRVNNFFECMSRFRDKNKMGEFKMANWTVDQSHSSVGFEVKHMMVSKVKGQFETYTAEVDAADLTDLTSASIAFKFDVASINTRSEDRDNHLRSADFFDVENNPTIEFTSTSIIKDGDEYSVTGDLTIKAVTKPVTFAVEFNGKGKNPWGVEVYGFEAEAKINREEFGLTWNAALETGGVLVGKDIKIKVELEVNPAA
jgi:polyisoprenoid-binding protein YceI